MTTSAVQVVNSAHNDIQRTAFLSAMDRNFIFSVVNYGSMSQTSSTSALTVPFLTDLALHPTEMFSWDGVNHEVTIQNYPGIYYILARCNVGSGSGSPSDTIVKFWLEKSTVDSPVYAEVSGSVVYQTAPPIYYNSVQTEIAIKLLLTNLPAKVRVRSQVVHPAGTQSAFIAETGRLLQIIALQATNATPST